VSERLDAMSEYVVPPAGGLYVAQLSEFTSAMILPPAVRGLSDLRCVPRVDDRERSVETVLRLIGFARLWGIARLPGDVVSRTRQRAVLQALTSQIFQVLGGDAWGDAEAAARTRYDWVVELKRSVSRKREEAAIGAALALECEALASAAPNTRVTRVATLVGRFVPLSTRSAGKAGVGDGGPDDPSWLAELALRLASDPVGAEVWAGGHLRAGVARLFEVPTLARAARFLVIATDHHLNSHAAAGELYAGWGWQ
jgi:hypothetical protein